MTELNISIPNYPPFTLRSSLIDKDPVIWVHLLESYIIIFKFLTNDNFQFLTVKAKQHLYQFLKSYLYETYGESTKIFSLGAINPDILANESELKAVVFNFIKTFSILKLNLIDESIWYFIGIYVQGNSSIVRGLVDGTFKSKLNDNKKSGNISSISNVQTFLQKRITQGKFSSLDLTYLSSLLGQSISSTTKLSLNNSQVDKKINKKKSVDFASKFVSKDWINILENFYVNGKGIHASIVKDIMVVSLISLSISSIIHILDDLDILRPSSMIKAPLFCSILISPEFDNLIPIHDKIPYLLDSFVPITKQEDIDTLKSIFPDLTDEKAKRILIDNDNNVEHVTNLLLENPELIDSIEPLDSNTLENNVSVSSKALDVPREQVDRFQSDNFTKLSKKSIDTKTLKEKTMVAALRLLYESDEDEPDDTYAEQDAIPPETTSKSVSKPFSSQEEFLFSVFKRDGPEAFDKTSRKNGLRGKLKKQTGWSDEQIEGWLKMLIKSPTRFKILEENYLYGNGNPNRKKVAGDVSNEADQIIDTTPNKAPDKANDKATETKTDKKSEKKTQAFNDRNKAKKANHNRKQGHSKKTRELI